MVNTRESMASRTRIAQTPAEELRQLLTHLENLIGTIGRINGAAKVEILDLLDQANALTEQIIAAGGDLTAELTRLETLTQQLDKRKAGFLKDIGGAEVLKRLRATREPAGDAWWWYADVRLDAERRLRRTYILRRSALTVLLLVILASLYALFLAPDESTRERHRHQQDAEQALTGGDPAAALVEADLALTYAPDNSDLLILKGVALQLLGEVDQAQAAYDRAQALLGETEPFLAARSQTYMVANRAGLALADAQHIIELNPNSAEGYFLMGSAHAAAGSYYEATDALDRASELAGAAGQTELQGMARVQLANLMLLMQSPDLGTETQPSE